MNRHAPWWVSIILGILAIVGWAFHWHIAVNNGSKILIRPAASQQDGKIWTAQCLTVKAGTPEHEVVSLYGMPRGDDQDNGSTDLFLAYPLEEDSSKTCTIDFTLVDNKVYQVQLDVLNQGGP